MHCDDVALQPRTLPLSYARDSAEVSGLLDIHTFTKFFTYQMPNATEAKTNIVETRFDPSAGSGGKDQSGQGGRKDLVLRLRASLRAAGMDNTQQGMRVSVTDEQSGQVVVDGTTEDSDERRVHLDSLLLASDRAYIIRYEFFQKSVGLRSFDDKIEQASAGHMGASACSKPFVVQELVIAAQELIVRRAKQYQSSKSTLPSDSTYGPEEHELSMIAERCQFSTLNNTGASLEHGEAGLYCPRSAFSYSLVGEAPQELNVLFQKSFSIAGAESQAVTYLFDLTLGFDFATSAQLKAVLQRVDAAAGEHQFDYDPLSCLLDHSCVESEQVGKNEVNIEVILTVGDYKLIIFDQQENGVRRWLTGEVGLTTAPFTLELQATPIVQNEERVMCGDKLYLAEQYIQSRFIDDKAGQRFTFEDDVILSLVNTTQRIRITPEADMVLKISAKEAYGVNMAMSLCSQRDCQASSSQAGNTDVLYATLNKGVSYYVDLDYSDSIITLASFYDCPHTRLKISMMKVDEAQSTLKAQADKPSDWIASQSRTSDAQLAGIFDTISQAAAISGAGYVLAAPEAIFVYEARRSQSDSKLESTVLVQKDFKVPAGSARQVMIEVYFDAQFYDLELLIEARQASEVRSHLYSGHQNTDISKYKGAKRVFVEAEPGDYTFKVVAKLPGASKAKDLTPRYYEFQLYAVSASTLPSRALRPPSLNYFGLLGPTGAGFGQLVYLLPEVLLEPRDWIDLEMILSGPAQGTGRGPTVDVQAIETDGAAEQLDISLTELPKVVAGPNGEGGAEAAPQPEKHPKSSRYRDEWEDGVEYESLLASDLEENTRYRMRLANRDSAMSARASLKMVITERQAGSKAAGDVEILPKSFSEVLRVKPKVPGLKESSFIQGSKAVMEAFKVASLQPFVPKSEKVYQAVFRTGASTDDSFMPSLDFSVDEQSAQLFVQVTEFSGREDLFLTLYSADEGESTGRRHVARSTLGKYTNTLGPVTLSKGKYRLVVHPDQDSTSLATNSELIRFGLDALLEQSDIGGGDFDVVVEQVELCNLPALPDNFNGPGFLHPLSGQTLQAGGKYRIAELLEGTAVKFELAAASLVTFYLELPEGLKAKAALVRVKGTYTTKVATEDLNKADETFLRQSSGFQHRAVIQLREFLDAGAYMIKLQATEAAAAGSRVMPRCEAYQMGLTVTPHSKAVAAHREDEGCPDSQYVPEHLSFDEAKGGSLAYPVMESSTDVAYIDLASSGEGPFVFFFQIQYDPRVVGVVGLSLSAYDAETARFGQTALWRSPQDGLTQILTVVESGTYAVGIQTLTSTPSMFLSGGLGSGSKGTRGGKLLHDNCLGLTYSYLVASTLRGDSRTLDAGAGGLMELLVGGGLQKLALQQERDSKLLDELGDPGLLATCAHDDLVSQLPHSENGFDRSFTLLVQEKPSDVLDLVIEQESLLRVSVHSNSPKNQVKVYLYQNSKAHDALAWSSGSRVSNTLLRTLPAQKRAYRLKLEYDSLDQDDPCPTFDLRIIVRPVKELAEEYLRCDAKPLPPARLPVVGADFSHSGDYAFSSDYLASAQLGQGEGLEYDVALDWAGADPSAEYYLDVETRSDVLTGQLTFTLLYEDAHKALRPLGRSHSVGSAAHGGRFIQRLKLLDREGDLADDVDLSGAILRLKLPPSSLQLVDSLRAGGHVAAGSEICHNLELSVRAELRTGENEDGSAIMGPSRLVRVRWEGNQVDGGHYDPAARLTATLEFDRSMKGAFQLLKASAWASLAPEKPTASGGAAAKTAAHAAMPTLKKLSTSDPSSILLQFPAGSLVGGWCHRLVLSAPGGPGGIDFDEQLLAADLRVCATPSTCHCHWAGTVHCTEATGVCTCKWPHVGADCSQCAEGHAKDAATGECEPASKCVDLGGTEDCHGHGSCEQVGGTAKCACNKGFADDGLEQCAKCTDPLFEYPDCQLRSWILDEPDVTCKDLESRMPKTLWKDTVDGAQGLALQGRDGVLNWAQRYSLMEGRGLRKRSAHQFIVPTSSVLHLFVDTGKSGARVRYQVQDAESAVWLSSAQAPGADNDGFLTSGSEASVLHVPKGKNPTKAPYTLMLEFESDAGGSNSYNGYKGSAGEESCPWLDIHLVVEPLATARAALRCNEAELSKSSVARSTGWEFGYESKFVKEQVTLRSDDSSLYTYNGKENTAFATLRYQLAIRSGGNALSLVATYPLSSMTMAMTLIDERTGDVVKLERTSSLEGDKEAPAQAVSQAHDTTSFIEVPALEAGQYRLEVELRRSLFLPTKQWPTCLSFDLVAEYVARTHKGSTAEGMYEVLAVRPLTLEQLEVTSARVIEVDFDKELVLDDLVNGPADRFYVCSLINTADSKDIIHPRAVRKTQATLRLDFDFAKAKISNSNRCYKLQCSTEKTKGKENIWPLAEETSYCFESSDEHQHSVAAHCNPLAQPKLDGSGRCICAAPYTGRDCESCEAGFTDVKEKLKERGSGKTTEKEHTRCVVDESHLSNEAACSGHGRPKSTRVQAIEDVECVCDKGYGGAYCDYCTDSTVAYPDCVPGLSAAIYDDKAAHAFLSRRRYSEHGYSSTADQYFPRGALEPTVFNEECGWVDFPDDLGRIEFTNEFSSGEFHFADLYVTNHKQDNIIKFIPRSTGLLKVLLQQPEAEELLAGDAEAPFDLEVGVYDPQEQKFVASAMNRHLTLPRGQAAKLEYAALTFEATQDHLSRPLYIFFRALNFTDDEGAGHKAAEGCLSLYIEAEFRATTTKCKNSPALEPSSEIKILEGQSQASVLAEVGTVKAATGSEHSISNPANTFFAYQDYYIPEGSSYSSNGDADRIVTVSLQQKFIESNTLDIVVEILEADIARDAIKPQAYPAVPQSTQGQEKGLETRRKTKDGRDEASQGNMGPSCRGTCLVGGEKSLNEMQRVVELSSRTYFRVWVFQQAPKDRESESSWCANYQLLVSTRDAASGEAQRLSQHLRCRAEELPTTLDTPRYLKGLDGQQKDFHYRESFRVDHLWHNPAHKVSFTLKEASLVRIVAPVHRHLEFEIVLNEDHGAYSHKTIYRAKREDYHSTIFAQLSPGEYHFKIDFVSDAAPLQLPCQTVQLELAIMNQERAQAKAQVVRDSRDPNAVTDVDMQQLLVKSGGSPVSLFQPGAVGWRHVEPGVDQHVDQHELYLEIFRKGFEIEADDEAGLIIEVQSDFLLSGVNVAINNVATGAVVEDERRDSSGKLVVGRLVPGSYELFLYTHECVTNMATSLSSPDGRSMRPFDLALKISVRLLRVAGANDASAATASVPVEILDWSQARDGQPRVQGTAAAAPLAVTPEELVCLKEFLPLPRSLDGYISMGSVDLSETFYIGTNSYHSHEMSFTPIKGHTALRIIIAKSNSKIVLLEQSGRQVVAQSRPAEAGKGQLLIAPALTAGTPYTIVLEFSELAGLLDGGRTASCAHFMMSVRTWDSEKTCSTVDLHTSQASVTTQPDSEPQTTTFALLKKSERKGLQIEGSNAVDLEVTLDYSDAFFKADLTLRSASNADEKKSSAASSSSESEAALRRDLAPSSVDFQKKHAVTYLFTDIPAGAYELKLRQRFKEKSGCGSPVSATIRTWKAASGAVSLEKAGHAGQNLFQSQAEEQERPRAANRLPLNLNTYKFMGGESNAAANALYLLFSGPVQLDEQESQNRITFEVMKEGTVVRAYAEHSGLMLTLTETTTGHAKVVSSGGTAILHTVGAGTYSITLGHGTAQAREAAELIAARTQLTIMVADPEAHAVYNKTWEKAIGNCDAGTSFPLALKQQRQADTHQLYYNYPLIKVSPSVLRSQSVLQTYNLRLNVTSRLYFEVGMHMLNSQVTLQLSALHEKGYTIQGKQRGNLNVLDTQVGPGDYSIALKQAVMPQTPDTVCGIFSLQGLVEPINLMSASANSGEILQRGISACSEAADGDILPMQIFANKAATKGGGELHLDAAGHFMKRFRNVLFKMSREYSEVAPEYDRVELAVEEDSLVHLTFLYEAYEANEIRVALADTYMMGQEVAPQASYKIQDIEGDLVELVVEYRLSKGRHYGLTVYYVGGPQLSDEGRAKCSVYDLSMSISHQAAIIEETRCSPHDSNVKSLAEALPVRITDKNLDSNGEYHFDQILKMTCPEDFKLVEKAGGKGKARDILVHQIQLQLDSNFDITATIEFGYAEALFTMSLVEEVRDADGELQLEESHQQSPLVFKQNNDHYQSVRRELVADGVEAARDGREHSLMITNQQADILHLLNPDPGATSCLNVRLTIEIKASQRSTKALYTSASKRGTAPMLIDCRPGESPVFVHGRTTQAHFDIRFNRRPFSSGAVAPDEQADGHLGAHIKLRAVTVSIPAGVSSTILLEPVKVDQSNKGYQEDAYHVAVTFDLSELQSSASIKLTHAQLVVENDELVDSDGRKFTLEKKLAGAGLPIYVYEQNDMEQLVSEETDAVKAAVADSAVGRGAEHDDQAGTDIQTDQSSFEATIAAGRLAEAATSVECKCVHGTCRPGQASCASCESGWKGDYCDVPLSDSQTHVNKNKKKDYTRDGLYRPMQIQDQRLTGVATEKPQTPSAMDSGSTGSRAQEQSSDRYRAKSIDGEVSTQTSVTQRSTRDQAAAPIAPRSSEEPTTAPPPEGDASPPSAKGANLMFVALLAFLLYALAGGAQLCPPRGAGADPRSYRPLGEQGPGADSDGDEEVADPVARRRMLELSSFGSGASKQNEGGSRQASTRPDAPEESVSRPNRGSFPMTNFSRGPATSDSSTRQSALRGGDDETADQLQRELELFAQDDEEEEGSLMQGSYTSQAASYDKQPQNSAATGQPQSQEDENDENELQQYETFFDDQR